MGSVMSYSLGLGPDRPRPAGILAFSGFVPSSRAGSPTSPAARHAVFIAHGRNDPIMDVGFARRARDLLEGGGVPVDYHESDAGHHIDPAHVPAAIAWLGTTLAPCRRGRAMSAAWPALPYEDWRETKETLHRFAQIVGKVRMALVPPLNHWWHVTLLPSAHGLTTGPMPAGDRWAEIEFDFVDHRVHVRTSEGRTASIALRDRLPLRALLRRPLRRALGRRRGGRDPRPPVRPRRQPAVRRRTRSTTATTPPRSSASGPSCAARTRCWPGSRRASPARRARRTSSGTASTSRTRASRGAAPGHPGRRPGHGRGLLARGHRVRLVAGGRAPHAVPGVLLLHRARARRLTDHPLEPADAAWTDTGNGSLAVLPYDGVRAAGDPAAALLAFFESAYRAGATAAGWDGAALARP
jgi:hypothetical protein